MPIHLQSTEGHKRIFTQEILAVDSRSASDQALPREPSNLIRIKTWTSHLLLSNWNNPPTDLSNFYGILDWPNFTPTLSELHGPKTKLP